MFERTRKFVSQKPTESELSKYQSDKIYEPSTSDVLSASSVDALEGQGTGYQLNVLKNVTTEKIYGTPISQDKFNELKGNTNIQYQPDMTEQSVKILKKYHDEQDYRNFVLSKATTGQSIAGFGASLATGFLDPKNIITGLGAGAIFNKGISTLSKKTGRTLLSANSTKRALQFGAGTVLIEGAVSVPIDINTANKLQQEYSVKDAVTDAIIGGVIGTGLDVGVTAFQARKARINEQQAQIKLREENPLDFEIIDVSSKYNLDADILYAMTMAESNGNPTAVNADTGAYGFWQAMPETAKEYGVTKQSTLKEQADAFARFTADNVTALEKSLGRKPNATETYLAHWLGRSGAIEVLNADPNASFVKHMRNTPYYKKDGVSYAKSVMTQNRLPKTASMAEVINTAKLRVTKNLGASKHIPVSKDILEKIDLKINQAMEGENVDLDALIATHLQRDYQNGLKFINAENQKILEQRAEVSAKLQDAIANNNIDDFDVNLLSDLDTQYAENIETKLQEFRDNVLEYQKNNDIHLSNTPSLLEIDHEFYKAEFKNIKALQKKSRELKEKIDAFNLDEQIYAIATDSGTPLNVIKGMEEEIVNYPLLRQAESDKLTGKRKRLFDQETQARINELKSDLSFIKSESASGIRDANQTAKNQLKSLLSQYKKTQEQMQAKSQGLIDYSEAAQTNAENLYLQSIQNQLDVLNNPVYDKQAIDSLEKITQEVEDYKIDDELLSLETSVLDYKNSGLLDDNDLKAIEYVNLFNKEDFDNMKQQVTTCLLTGGTNEA